MEGSSIGDTVVEDKRAGLASSNGADPGAEVPSVDLPAADLSADDAATVKAAELIQKRARGVLGRKAVEDKRAGLASSNDADPDAMEGGSIYDGHVSMGGSPLQYKSLFSEPRQQGGGAVYSTPARNNDRDREAGGGGSLGSLGSVDSAAKRRKKKPLYLRIKDTYDKKISNAENEKVLPPGFEFVGAS